MPSSQGTVRGHPVGIAAPNGSPEDPSQDQLPSGAAAIWSLHTAASIPWPGQWVVLVILAAGPFLSLTSLIL